jgi:NADH:ubiquinone oxidoreductase subunit F (NADH-binding)
MDFAHVRAMAEKEAGNPADASRPGIRICAAPGNEAAGLLFRRLREINGKRGAPFRICRTGSFGCPDLEPVAVVDRPGHPVAFRLNADPQSPVRLDAAAAGGCAGIRGGSRCLSAMSELPLFRLQNRIALRNCGWIDPGSLAHFVLAGHGFAGLSRALQKDRRELIETLEASGLKDHLETGCSAIDQWRECAEIGSPGKYLVCNAVASGAAGAGARLLVESDPCSVLEGMLLGAFILGASRCILYIRSGSAAAANLRILILRMREYGLLGDGVPGTSPAESMEIREVPEDLRAGSELASLHAMTRDRSNPHLLPAYPGIGDLLANPVIVANPEAMAYLPALFLNETELGAYSGADIGKPSTVVAVEGAVARGVIVEVPCGLSIRRVIEEIAGGVSGGRSFKALRIGSPSGALVGAEALDDCLHCRLTRTFHVGAGSVSVIDDGADILETARAQMAALHDQSCGRCLLCFEGIRQMHGMLEAIAAGKGKPGDANLLVELGRAMKDGCLCAFGRTAPDFVLGSIELFRNEYEERMKASPPGANTV